MQFNLEFDIQSYWHIGTGQEGGAYADALTLKDDKQLPYLPGKSIKGLLKEAFITASENNWFTEIFDTEDNIVDLLFGQESKQGMSRQGLLQISSATLSEDEIDFLSNNTQAKSMLYKVTYSTAIEPESGVAKDTSLRSTEVTIPMTLLANVSVNNNHPAYSKIENQLNDHFGQWLNLALSLITELGAKRNRGLGKTIVTAKQITGVK
jgi:CRISPR/Cas system CSM-associated protein Csm3 (group 7 of RAMP superfamily)